MAIRAITTINGHMAILAMDYGNNYIYAIAITIMGI